MTSHGKVPWYSRSLWINTITAIVAAIAAIQGQAWIVEYPQVAAGLATVVAVLNIVLRLITSEPIKLANK